MIGQMLTLYTIVQRPQTIIHHIDLNHAQLGLHVTVIKKDFHRIADQPLSDTADEICHAICNIHRFCIGLSLMRMRIQSVPSFFRNPFCKVTQNLLW